MSDTTNMIPDAYIRQPLEQQRALKKMRGSLLTALREVDAAMNGDMNDLWFASEQAEDAAIKLRWLHDMKPMRPRG